MNNKEDFLYLYFPIFPKPNHYEVEFFPKF